MNQRLIETKKSEKVVDDVSGFNCLITQITKRNDKGNFLFLQSFCLLSN